jgi:hypothetical protein
VAKNPKGKILIDGGASFGAYFHVDDLIHYAYFREPKIKNEPKFFVSVIIPGEYIELCECCYG